MQTIRRGAGYISRVANVVVAGGCDGMTALGAGCVVVTGETGRSTGGSSLPSPPPLPYWGPSYRVPGPSDCSPEGADRVSTGSDFQGVRVVEFWSGFQAH